MRLRHRRTDPCCVRFVGWGSVWRIRLVTPWQVWLFEIPSLRRWQDSRGYGRGKQCPICMDWRKG